MANFNKRNCQTCVRLSIKLCNGYSNTQIIVTGQHAFEYTVTVISPNYNKSLRFSNRTKAIKETGRLKRQYLQLGFCRLAV